MQKYIFFNTFAKLFVDVMNKIVENTIIIEHF